MSEVTEHLIWHADKPMTYRSGSYRLYWTTMGWSAWDFSKRKALLIRDVRLPEAMKACEDDLALQTQKG